MKVLIGVDPHKATNAVAVLNEAGKLLLSAHFPQNRAGLRALDQWARRFPERRWAIEGANGLGRTLAQRLASAGEEVIDVPARSFPLGSGCSPQITGVRTIGWTQPSRLWPL